MKHLKWFESMCDVLWELALNRLSSNSLCLLNMPPLTKEQRTWVCVEYAKTDNAEEVKRRCNVPAPCRKTIKKTFNKFDRPFYPKLILALSNSLARIKTSISQSILHGH